MSQRRCISTRRDTATRIESCSKDGADIEILAENLVSYSNQLGQKALTLLALLFERPIVNVKLIQARLDVAWGTANRLVGQLEEVGLLREITGQKRSRVFRYDPYLELVDEPEVGDDHTQA